MPASLARYEYYPTGAVKRVTLGNDGIAIDYTYHISGAVKTAVATNLANNSTLFSEALYYEDCGSSSCTPQYNGNISRMVQSLAHGNANYKEARDVMYAYDFMNRLTGVDDHEQDDFDEYFAYDAQGRITSQRRGTNAKNSWGGDYSYYTGTNKLEKVANGMGGTADKRDMSASGNFVYDSEGNLIEDKYLQGEAAKIHLCIFIAEPQRIALCASPSP